MRRAYCMMIVVTVLFANPAFAQQDSKRTVAVMDFDFSTVQKWWEGNWEIGRGVSDILVDELLKSDTYRVLERRHLEMVLEEQKLTNARGAAGRSNLIAKLWSADALITGSITQFGTESKKSVLGGFIGRLSRIDGGTVGRQKGKAKVSITARIVDTTTGEVLASTTGTGESKRQDFLIGGAGLTGGGLAAAGLSIMSSGFRETILGEATFIAIAQLVEGLLAAQDKFPEVKLEPHGKVAFVDGTTVVVNVGNSQGVTVGDVLAVSRIKNTIKDPDTGKIIKEDIEELGQVRVEQVDVASSTATVMNGSGFQIGNLVTRYH